MDDDSQSLQIEEPVPNDDCAQDEEKLEEQGERSLVLAGLEGDCHNHDAVDQEGSDLVVGEFAASPQPPYHLAFLEAVEHPHEKHETETGGGEGGAEAVHQQHDERDVGGALDACRGVQLADGDAVTGRQFAFGGGLAVEEAGGDQLEEGQQDEGVGGRVNVGPGHQGVEVLEVEDEDEA